MWSFNRGGQLIGMDAYWLIGVLFSMLYFTDNKIQILITGHLTDGRLVEVRLYFLVVFKLIAQETQKHVRL